jgi:hypothetical protein
MTAATITTAVMPIFDPWMSPPSFMVEPLTW